MRRFKYMLWLLVAVFCLMPCGVSAAETQKDLKIQEVFQRYGKKRNVTMVELSNEMLETYGMTRYKSMWGCPKNIRKATTLSCGITSSAISTSNRRT